MDPNANAGNHDPVNPPKPHDIAEPGPIDPTTGQPDHGAEVSALKGWFRENLTSRHPPSSRGSSDFHPDRHAEVIIGLGLVIFILSRYFLAAKWCDVHVGTSRSV